VHGRGYIISSGFDQKQWYESILQIKQFVFSCLIICGMSTLAFCAYMETSAVAGDVYKQ